MSKYGFDVPITFEALDSILRLNFNIPEGEPINVFVDQEREIISVRYRTNEKDGFRVGQAGEYPKRIGEERSGLLTAEDIKNIRIFK